MKTKDKLDQLFDWFAKTEQSEILRKQALESVGLEYRIHDSRRQNQRARKES